MVGWDHNGFNPRSREGSDIIEIFCPWIAEVSIHAPAKGATEAFEFLKSHLTVSIHAPAKGATVSAGELLAGHQQFQSTLPRRERHRPLWEP